MQPAASACMHASPHPCSSFCDFLSPNRPPRARRSPCRATHRPSPLSGYQLSVVALHACRLESRLCRGRESPGTAARPHSSIPPPARPAGNRAGRAAAGIPSPGLPDQPAAAGAGARHGSGAQRCGVGVHDHGADGRRQPEPRAAAGACMCGWVCGWLTGSGGCCRASTTLAWVCVRVRARIGWDQHRGCAWMVRDQARGRGGREWPVGQLIACILRCLWGWQHPADVQQVSLPKCRKSEENRDSLHAALASSGCCRMLFVHTR